VLAPDWFERRDTITLQAGDAVAANKAIQMRDPWPPYVANRNIPFNGVVMDQRHRPLQGRYGSAGPQRA
jgi:hypothetical protein